jgi:hypothetical protein
LWPTGHAIPTCSSRGLVMPSPAEAHPKTAMLFVAGPVDHKAPSSVSGVAALERKWAYTTIKGLFNVIGDCSGTECLLGSVRTFWTIGSSDRTAHELKSLWSGPAGSIILLTNYM